MTLVSGVPDMRVLHLFDCADVGRTLVSSAQADGRDWHLLPVRDTSRDDAMAGVRGRLEAARWEARRRVEVRRAQLVHVHYGPRASILRRGPRRPYVLHLHGTDIRTQYHDARYHDEIQRCIDDASAVVYATPDLEPHALAARPDATYLPNPIDVSHLPRWSPGPQTVAFASRWEDAKGGSAQVDLARRLVAAHPGVEFVGLDWGERAAEAADAGVRLVPTMPGQGYLRWLARATAVVGQSTGLVGISELQAIAIGVPVLMPLTTVDQGGPPLVSGPPEQLVQELGRVLDDPVAVSERLAGRAWAEAERSPRAAVARLAAIYAQVLA